MKRYYPKENLYKSLITVSLVVIASVNYAFTTRVRVAEVMAVDRALDTTNLNSTPLPKPTIDDLLLQYFDKQAPTARRVAMCESSLNPQAKNKRSTASGLFQITNPTWKWLKCDGDKLDAESNIKCAKKLYDKYGWGSTASWKASIKCWGSK